MTVFVDEVRDHGPGKGKWSHLWTDGDIEELHTLADAIGLKRSWFQTRPHSKSASMPHYDVRPNNRDLALKAGARFIRLADWIESRRQMSAISYGDGGDNLRACEICGEYTTSRLCHRCTQQEWIDENG